MQHTALFVLHIWYYCRAMQNVAISMHTTGPAIMVIPTAALFLEWDPSRTLCNKMKRSVYRKRYVYIVTLCYVQKP